MDIESTYTFCALYLVLTNKNEIKENLSQFSHNMKNFFELFDQYQILKDKINFDKLNILIAKYKNFETTDLIKKIKFLVRSNVSYQSTLYSGKKKDKSLIISVKNQHLAIVDENFNSIHNISYKYLKNIQVK